MRIYLHQGVRLSTFIAAAAVAVLATSASAEEPLRWKFEKGQKLNYNMVQDMAIAPQGGAQGGQKMQMRQEMNMTWDVQDINAAGEAIIKQKFDRLKVKMTMPPLGTIEYDSKSEAAPDGLAAMIAPMYKAMMDSEFELTMTPRGEIKDVKVPEKVINALKNSPGGAQMGEMATPEGFKKMVSQSALVLPENAPKVDEKWSTTVEMKNPAGGKQLVETTYLYAGTKEVDGTKFAQFKPTIKLTFDGAGDLKVTDQSSDGEILFNATAGRLSSSELNQKMTLEQAGQGAMIEQTIQATVLTPEEAAAAAAKEAAAEPAKTEPAAEAAKTEAPATTEAPKQ